MTTWAIEISRLKNYFDIGGCTKLLLLGKEASTPIKTVLLILCSFDWKKENSVINPNCF